MRFSSCKSSKDHVDSSASEGIRSSSIRGYSRACKPESRSQRRNSRSALSLGKSTALSITKQHKQKRRRLSLPKKLLPMRSFFFHRFRHFFDQKRGVFFSPLASSVLFSILRPCFRFFYFFFFFSSTPLRFYFLAVIIICVCHVPCRWVFLVLF